jgi:hypothetical protein
MSVKKQTERGSEGHTGLILREREKQRDKEGPRQRCRIRETDRETD